MIPWPAKLAAYFASLALVVLLILYQPLRSSVDGYTIFVVTLSAILMLYSLLLTNSRGISRKLALIVGPDIGTTGANSSPSNTDSLLSRFTAILVETGQSWLQVSALLKNQGRQLEELMRWASWKEGVEVSNTAEADDDNSPKGTEEEAKASDPEWSLDDL